MMDETTIKSEAIKLRQELKYGRQRSVESGDSGTTEDHVGYDQSIDGKTRSGISVLQGTGSRDGRRTRTVRRDGRSTIRGDGRVQGELEQSRPGYRRPNEQHPSFITGSTADATEGTRRSVDSKVLGNFERQDDVPTRQFVDPTTLFEQSNPRSEANRKRGPGRPKKQEAISEYQDTKVYGKIEIPTGPVEPKSFTQSIKNIIPSGRVRSPLSDTEAKGFAPVLKGALKDYGRYADQYLNSRLSTAGTIWGNLDADELDSLVTSLLSIGKRSGTVAEGVRMVAHSNDYITTVMILVPRLMQTTQVLQQAPPRPRKTVSERGDRFRSRFRSRLGEKINE